MLAGALGMERHTVAGASIRLRILKEAKEPDIRRQVLARGRGIESEEETERDRVGAGASILLRILKAQEPAMTTVPTPCGRGIDPFEDTERLEPGDRRQQAEKWQGHRSV